MMKWWSHIRAYAAQRKRYIVAPLLALNVGAALFIGYYYFTEIAPYKEWQSYTDAAVGYSIKYPNDWYLHDDAYISPLSESALRREYPASMEVWGIGVGSADAEAFASTIDQELRLVKSKNADADILIARLVERPEHTIIQAVVRNFGQKILPPVYKATFMRMGGEWVIYWVSDGKATWRIDYIYPFEKGEDLVPMFEKVLSTIRTGPENYAWGPAIVEALGGEDATAPEMTPYFLTAPAAGFSVPERASFPAGFSLQSKVFTSDYSEYAYLHRRFGSHIEVVEDERTAYIDAVAEYEAREGEHMQYDKEDISVGGHDGIGLAWYADEAKKIVASVTLLIDKDGHLLKVVRDATPDETLSVTQTTAELGTFSEAGQ